MKTSTGLVAVGAYTVGALVAYRVLKSARDADADSVAHWVASGVRKSGTTSFLSQLREAFGVGASADADDANGGTTRRGGDANEREVPFVDGIEDRPAAERAEDASAARGSGRRCASGRNRGLVPIPPIASDRTPVGRDSGAGGLPLPRRPPHHARSGRVRVHAHLRRHVRSRERVAMDRLGQRRDLPKHREGAAQGTAVPQSDSAGAHRGMERDARSA